MRGSETLVEAENSTSSMEVGLEKSHLIWQVKPADIPAKSIAVNKNVEAD